MEAIKIEETEHHETYVIKSCFSYGDSTVTTFTMSKIRPHTERREYATLRAFDEEGARTIQLESDQMGEVCRLWGYADDLRQQLETLRAEHEKVVEDNTVLIQNQIEATEQIERLTQMKDEADDECLRLMEENKALQEQVYQAITKCGKAVNRAEILARRAQDLLREANDIIANWELEDHDIPSGLAVAVTRMEEAIDSSIGKEVQAAQEADSDNDPLVNECPF